VIIVTGTKRSGTSMWMQALKAAGLPVLGEAFSGSWGESIRDANPKGFYESPFRQGVFYATNPDPKTGAYLRPEETKRVVVKVFVPGLIRTDIAYVDHVIATMRPWREYTRSIRKLYALEDAHTVMQGVSQHMGGRVAPLHHFTVIPDHAITIGHRHCCHLKIR